VLTVIVNMLMTVKRGGIPGSGCHLKLGAG
jgi:hypothetical protein